MRGLYSVVEFTVFALFYLVFEGNFQVQAPGGLYLVGRFKEGFFVLRVWEACIWRAYTWRGLFSEFYGIFFVYRQIGLELLNRRRQTVCS